jgi:hypothetical protein
MKPARKVAVERVTDVSLSTEFSSVWLPVHGMTHRQRYFKNIYLS